MILNVGCHNKNPFCKYGRALAQQKHFQVSVCWQIISISVNETAGYNNNFLKNSQTLFQVLVLQPGNETI